MKFGPVALDDAAGATLAHSVATPSGTLRKGTVLDDGALAKLRGAGIGSVIAARLEPGDVTEDEAAGRLAAALAGPGVRVDAAATGRANLHAVEGGLFEVATAAVDAINRINPALTVATRPPMRGVEAGRMIATVKVIPFAVAEHVVASAVEMAREREPVLRIRPFVNRRIAVISTLLPALKLSVVDKTVKVLRERLASFGGLIDADIRVPHEIREVADAIRATAATHDLVLVFGASAVVDEADVIPAAISRAGGEVIHFGMPVDPGNLLVLGRLGDVPVLGAPGCARSPRENGFDFVLERVLAGSMPGAADIMGMGVGGLLMDIVSRPAPRTGEALREDPDAPRIAAVVLAAGRSRRFGDDNKLLQAIGGETLVRRAARAALEGGAAEVLVVTGHDRDRIEAALAGLAVRFIHNADFADGQASSVRSGIAAVPDGCEAALVLLGDMPLVDAAVVRSVIAAYKPAAGSLVVVPVHEGQRGNPVLWSRRYFPDLIALAGDRGARDLIARDPAAVVTVEAGPAVLVDIDTPDDLGSADGKGRSSDA